MHARSIVGCAIDENAGEVTRRRFGYEIGEVLEWARGFPQPVAVAYARRGHEGNERLHRRREQMIARKKRSTIANVAIARELAGWCWSFAVMPDGPLETGRRDSTEATAAGGATRDTTLSSITGCDARP